MPGLTPDDGFGGLGGVRGDFQAGGEIVGAPLRQIAYKRLFFQYLQTGDDLVERTVPTHGHHGIVSAALIFRDAAGIPGSRCAADTQGIAGVAEGGGSVIERPPGLAAARPGIDDHQQLFFGHKDSSHYGSNGVSVK